MALLLFNNDNIIRQIIIGSTFKSVIKTTSMQITSMMIVTISLYSYIIFLGIALVAHYGSIQGFFFTALL